MNLCESCKKFDTCGVRIDGVDRHSCIWIDPITRADLAARDAEIERIADDRDAWCAKAGTLEGATLRLQHEKAASVNLMRAAQEREKIADLKRGGVVVPEFSDAEAGGIAWENGYDDDNYKARGLVMAAWAYARAHSSAHSRVIPADRVLGEGKVAVDQEELEALRYLLDCARIAAHAVEDEGECEMSSICGAVFACDSLRAQPTQEPTP